MLRHKLYLKFLWINIFKKFKHVFIWKIFINCFCQKLLQTHSSCRNIHYALIRPVLFLFALASKNAMSMWNRVLFVDHRSVWRVISDIANADADHFHFRPYLRFRSCWDIELNVYFAISWSLSFTSRTI